MTSVPETTSCRPALHQGALGPPPPAPPHSQAQEHTQTCAHTHTHARHAPGNACRRLRRDWLEGKRCARQRPLPLLDPGVSQGLGLEVKRDRDGAGETSCSPGLSWREGPGGIRGNCPAGLPAPLPSGGGASGPPVCVCGGGAGPPSWAGGREGALLRTGLPRPLRELSGEEAPASGRASRLALGAALGAPLFPRASSPHAPFRTQLGAREAPRPSRRLRRPPRCVRTRARWGCVPGAGGGTRGSGFTSPGPRQVRVDGSLAKWSVSPSQGDLPAWGTLSATEPILESPEISGSESLHCLSASTLGRHPGPSDGAVQSGRWAGAAWTAVQTGRARATRGEARPPRVGPGLGRQAPCALA